MRTRACLEPQLPRRQAAADHPDLLPDHGGGVRAGAAAARRSDQRHPRRPRDRRGRDAASMPSSASISRSSSSSAIFLERFFAGRSRRLHRAQGLGRCGLIAERLPVTLFLTAFAALLAVLLAVPLAFVAALRRGSGVDAAIRTGLPDRALDAGLLHRHPAADPLRRPTAAGFRSAATATPSATSSITCSCPRSRSPSASSAVLMRNLRNSIIEVLDGGLCRLRPRQGAAQPRVVLVQHVLRNALIPTVTLLGLNIGTLLGGAVITETVFAVPGRRPADDRFHLRPGLSGHPGPDAGAGARWSRWSSS